MPSSFADLKASRAARQSKSNTALTPASGDAEKARSTDKQSNAFPAPNETAIPSVKLGEEADQSVAVDSSIYCLPSSLQLRKSPTRGRGLYAAKAIRAGSVILRVEPTVSTPSTARLSEHCSGCGLSPTDISLQSNGNPPQPLKRCTICRLTWYCSTQCQRDDWTLHKPECAAHKALKAAFLRSNPGTNPEKDTRWIIPERVRFLGRLCWKRRLGRSNAKDPEWWRAVSEMESHLRRLKDEEVFKLGQEIQQLRYYLAMSSESGTIENPVPADMEEFGFDNTAQLLNLVSAISVNSFTLSSPSISPLGIATSPTAALCNHSCTPNAVVVFPNGSEEMVFVAIADIKPGQEVLTSYVDVSLPRHLRQADLKKQYGFDCDCPLCSKDLNTAADPRWTVFHTACAKKGTGYMPDIDSGADQSTCSDCGQVFSVNASALGSLITRSRDILQQDERGSLDQDLAVNEISTILPSILRLMPPTSYPAFPLLRLQILLLTSTGRSQDLRTAAYTSSVVYGAAEAVHPPGHPTLAIILASWGKLLAVEPEETATKQEILERLTEAVFILRKASVACERGFGPGGGLVGKEVAGLLRGCEGEIGLLRTAK